MALKNGPTGGGRVYHSITVVNKVAMCVGIVENLFKCSRLGLDAEGVAPRSRGEITMITIATPGRHVYIFDVKETEDLFEKGNLKLLLESSTALKVVHDFRNIAETLYNTFGVRVRKIFDTHAAYQTIALQKGLIEKNAIGLDDLFALYEKPKNPESQYVARWKNSNPQCFTLRPVTKSVAHYVAFNVCSLLAYVYEEQLRRISLKYWPLLAALSDDQLGNRTNSKDLVEEALLQAARTSVVSTRAASAAVPEHGQL